MKGFTGFYSNANLLSGYEYYMNILAAQCSNDDDSNENCLLSDHLALGAEYMDSIGSEGERLFLALYGSVTNANIIKKELDLSGQSYPTKNLYKTLLCGFAEWGTSLFPKLEGSFSFVLFDERNSCLYLVRDGFGCKPLFYSEINGQFLFGTRLRFLLNNPNLKCSVSKAGFNEIFSLGPSHTPGAAVYDMTKEVRPGFYIKCDKLGMISKRFYKLRTLVHMDSEEETIQRNLELLKKAVQKNVYLTSKTYREFAEIRKPAIKIGSLLSGGIDSSIVTRLLKEEMGDTKLFTYSFEFTDNDKFYQQNDFQPSLDHPYVEEMVHNLNTQHTTLTCNSKELFDSLTLSVKAHDLPAMADVDSSLIYFMNRLKENVSGVFAGECADEIYGGYPWFHRENLMYADTFPWMIQKETRKLLLKDDFLEFLEMDDYIRNAYHKTVEEITFLPDEDPLEKTLRRNEYLSITWFMQTLLNRMERASAVSGVETYCPFADRELIEYAYNTPFRIKSSQCTPKNILRKSCKGLLPETILTRKKSPFPKTYHPDFEDRLKNAIRERMYDYTSPLHSFLDENKVEAYLSKPLSYHTPWYGQLMAGPQLLSYLLQVDEWICENRVTLLFS
ncbi:MAG: asparagine synthase-related protein [Lachnospiraceae bacterium]|nr:asparagine synthase-related protein [Lachnospiraceae bacterium]